MHIGTICSSKWNEYERHCLSTDSESGKVWTEALNKYPKVNIHLHCLLRPDDPSAPSNDPKNPPRKWKQGEPSCPPMHLALHRPLGWDLAGSGGCWLRCCYLLCCFQIMTIKEEAAAVAIIRGRGKSPIVGLPASKWAWRSPVITTSLGARNQFS